MLRRKFMFWVGFGLFGLSEKLRANSLDDLAAALMRTTEPKTPTTASAVTPEHWSMAGNNTWRWYERENLIDGRWKITGITTPVDRITGERYTGRTGYLDESLVPAQFRGVTPASHSEPIPNAGLDSDAGKSSALRIARHGRPPSRWLRSLNANELHTWLRTIDPPEAGVEGMTFFEHLTRDHSFDAGKITGLDDSDLAKLHAAAHAGY
ncbi:MAG TPA: hypothetical protein VGN12_22530 [Pirellulales bacterium]